MGVCGAVDVSASLVGPKLNPGDPESAGPPWRAIAGEGWGIVKPEMGVG